MSRVNQEIPSYHRQNPEVFQTMVVEWYRKNGRVFPWREITDPFSVLLAEILLKRTGAERCRHAYEYLSARFSTPGHVEDIKLSDLTTAFRTLGLFNRADLIVGIARDLNQRFGGGVPETYQQLVSLAGIGPYTANAILCFSYGKRVALVDRSVSRVLRRCFGLEPTKIDHRDRALQSLAHELLPQNSWREYNLGLIDIGSLFCRHTKPRCTDCPLSNVCAHLET